MRITSIEVKNFKSLVDFRIDLAKFNVLVGLNGSGKSTVLQFIEFLSQLVRGRVDDWLKQRNWTSSELKTWREKRLITFTIGLIDDTSGHEGSWEASYRVRERRCESESFTSQGCSLKYKRTGIVVVKKPQDSKEFGIDFEYTGSLISQLKSSVLPEPLRHIKAFFESIESLEMLTPELLRKRSRQAGGSLGHGGKNIASYFAELSPATRRKVVNQLMQASPRLSDIRLLTRRGGWKELRLQELFDDHPVSFSARHVNDGLLRLLAILAEIESEHRLFLLDEIENGFNPERIEFVVDALVNAPQQVLATTHSPLILNYLDDEIARQGVIYIYKSAQGHTKAKRFFDLPRVNKKLGILGPGEAFVDTDLEELDRDLAAAAENP